jgi:tetratricopeptide (TPR) repeat protein
MHSPKPTATVFLSAASDDLKDWRDILHKAFERAGCKVHTQGQSLSASTGGVLDLLKHHLDQSDFVIHLAGIAYGGEPDHPPFPSHPAFQCSFTQFEYYYAHHIGKKVIAFVCAADFPYLSFTEKSENAADPAADRDRRRLLQLAHRDRLTDGRFAGTPLDGHPSRPLSESVKDIKELLIAAVAAIGRIRDDHSILQQALTAQATLHQLPARPEKFVGRTTDLEKLRAGRQSGAASISGIKGTGGIGKTALAYILAHEWLADFPDAQIMLNALGTSDNPPSAAELIAQVLHAFNPTAKLPEALADLQKLYHQTLTGLHALILLDNAKDADQARPLIPPPGCALIVTSRQSFAIGHVAPLRLGQLPRPEAIALLRTFHPPLTDADADALAKRCADLPLALKLAGTHLMLDASDRGRADVAGYLQRLSSGRLSTLNADAPDAGEIPISETLRLSEDALTPETRQIWRNLSVFPAPFDAAAALAIAGAGEPALQTLLRRSLIEADGPRYRLHDLAVEYAREKLGATALTELRLAHANHYRAVLATCGQLYLSGAAGITTGMAVFDTERSQIQAAHAWLLAAAKSEVPSLERDHLLIAYPNAGAYVLNLRHHPREQIAWLEAALAAARQLNDRRSEASALGNLGSAWADIGDARKAIGFHEQALVISREIGDRRAEGQDLGNLGIAWFELGDARKAIGFYEQRLVIAREIGDRRGEGCALGNLGIAWANLGNARQAIGFHEQALVISREIGDRRAEGQDLGNLGIAWFELGDARQAIGFYEQQLVIAREIGDQRGEANALLNSALSYESLHQPAEALSRAERGLAIYTAIESPSAEKARELIAHLRGA